MSNGLVSSELKIAHCPECGNIYQKNMRQMCVACYTKVDDQIRLIEKTLMRNRQLTNAELGLATAISQDQIYRWIRSGKIKLYDYPKLHDKCDSCAAPIRRGSICTTCSTRIQSEIAHELEQERLLKERIRANTYIARSR